MRAGTFLCLPSFWGFGIGHPSKNMSFTNFDRGTCHCLTHSHLASQLGIGVDADHLVIPMVVAPPLQKVCLKMGCPIPQIIVKNEKLVGGLEHFLFFPYIGNVISPTDEVIF